ncbi:hypothetical protein GCM10010403_05190 [Glycomyces rutgersensis]|uniref:Uncharacterized protein n=1 Tax=Glycomyces rutgersensis TaxID=58115 RepID=A0ABN3F6Z6_9ACTN
MLEVVVSHRAQPWHRHRRTRLERYPIRGLQEIKIIEHGEITQFYPPETEA